MRVFWFGMHKLLIQTELSRLRHLGFEVFCPKYVQRSSRHQSAANGWRADQPSTLPEKIFKKLSDYNFFYNPISGEMAEVLNKYFDAVIVTIDPAWLMEMLRVYAGKLVFRTYGHVVNMSNHLFANNGMRAITGRDNFWYVPHALECALHEHSWLREHMIVVPYCVAQNILSIRNT